MGEDVPICEMGRDLLSNPWFDAMKDLKALRYVLTDPNQNEIILGAPDRTFTFVRWFNLFRKGMYRTLKRELTKENVENLFRSRGQLTKQNMTKSKSKSKSKKNVKIAVKNSLFTSSMITTAVFFVSFILTVIKTGYINMSFNLFLVLYFEVFLGNFIVCLTAYLFLIRIKKYRLRLKLLPDKLNRESLSN